VPHATHNKDRHYYLTLKQFQMKKALYFGVAMTLVFVGQAYSQDVIYLKSDTINAQVLEIGLRRIKYQEKGLPVKIIRKRDVLRFEFSNGVYEDYGSMNPRKIRPLNTGIVISNYLFADSFLAELELNYFYKPYLTLSFNPGVDVVGNMFITTGPRYYLNRIHSDKKLVPFIGCQLGLWSAIDDLNTAGFVIQFPFGFDCITSKGNNYALHYSPRLSPDFNDSYSSIGIKIGKNF
jgi:hypothetical protein